jgi:hypothetical protein
VFQVSNCRVGCILLRHPGSKEESATVNTIDGKDLVNTVMDAYEVCADIPLPCLPIQGRIYILRDRQAFSQLSVFPSKASCPLCVCLGLIIASKSSTATFLLAAIRCNSASGRASKGLLIHRKYGEMHLIPATIIISLFYRVEAENRQPLSPTSCRDMRGNRMRWTRKRGRLQ